MRAVYVRRSSTRRWNRCGGRRRTPRRIRAGTPGSAASTPYRTRHPPGSATPPGVLPAVRIGGYGVHAGERTRPDGTRTSAPAVRLRRPALADRVGLGLLAVRARPGRGALPDGLHVRAPLGTVGPARRPRVPPGVRLGDRVVVRPAAAVAGAGRTAGACPGQRRPRGRSCGPAVAGVGALAARVTDSTLAGALAVLAATVVAMALPPHPHAPAARRCRRRRPPDLLAARPPSLLEKL